MANILEAIGKGMWDSIESPYRVLESAVKGDFGDAWHNLKAIPGNQERANSEIFNAAGIRGWVGDHPGESVGAVVGTVLAAPYVAAGAQSLFGTAGSSGIGATDFAKAPGKFGSMDFGGPSFSGKAPTSVPSFDLPSGTNATGGWQQTTNWGEVAADNDKLPWGDILKTAGDTLSKFGGDEEKVKYASAHRPGFKGVQLPASSFDSGALQNQMAAKEWASLGQPQAPMGSDINSLLKSFG